MPYPRRLLNDDETVTLDLHPHWWHFAKPAGVLVLVVAGGIAAYVMTDDDIQRVLSCIAIVAILASAAWLVKAYAQWSTTNFVITNRRVIYRSGVVAKRGIEIPLDRVNNVMSQQSVFERLLGAGDVMIESGGETGQQRFTDIKGPDRVQKMIHAQKHALIGGPGGVAAGTDVASQLEKLEGLLERGSISRDEFDSEKRRLFRN